MDKIPEEMIKNLSNIDEAMLNLENAAEQFLGTKPEYDQMKPLDKAREDLTTLFAINSCYWAHLRFKGKDPNDDAELATELARNKKYNNQLKKFEDLHKRPKYDPKTVGRFVKNALFDVSADQSDADTTTASSSSQSQSQLEWTEQDSSMGQMSNANDSIDAEEFTPVVKKRKRK